MEAQVTIQPVVVAHQSRLTKAAALAARLGTRMVTVDDGTKGEWQNHADALRWAARMGTSHVLCVEDDAVPVVGMTHEVRKAVEKRPDDCISLYVGTGRPRQEGVRRAISCADIMDLTWLIADSLCWGVAFVMPTADIEPMLEWAKTSTKPTDQRIGAWYRSQGRPVYYTWPSLVDHADVPSVIKGRPRPEKRVAHRVGVVEAYGDGAAVIKRIG